MYFVYFCMTWMPAYFAERRHLSLNSMGMYMMFSFGGIAAMSAIAGWAEVGRQRRADARRLPFSGGLRPAARRAIAENQAESRRPAAPFPQDG